MERLLTRLTSISTSCPFSSTATLVSSGYAATTISRPAGRRPSSLPFFFLRKGIYSLTSLNRASLPETSNNRPRDSSTISSREA